MDRKYFNYEPFINIGLLIIRVGIGVMFIFHGYPKVFGGPEVWAKVGSAVSWFGIDFWHPAWGLIAGLSEFGGGMLLILGLFFSPAAVAMLLTMLVATVMHLSQGDGLMGASHAIESGILFLGLSFVGPGLYSLDYFFMNKLIRDEKEVMPGDG